jgi:hypothetical protein
MYIGLHEKYPLFFSDFNETRIFSTDFENSSHIKFNKNSSGGSRVVPCESTDMTKLIVEFHNFANAPKKAYA